MGFADGTYQIGPETGRLLVKTARTGLGAKAGHDLTIEVTRWQGSVRLDTANPANSSVTLRAEVDAFEVRDGTGGVKPLTDADRGEIKRTLREKILHSRRHPAITFESSRVDGTAESFTVTGDLTITDVTQPVTVQCRAVDDRITGTAIVTQTKWRIRPYSAFFGALKLRDDVEVVFDVTLRPDG